MREEQKQTETQEGTKELEIVDAKLEAAIAPIVNTYSEISITKELFKKYCVPGATEAEIFFCMGKTRALGLDPLMPGEVHYIKFQGKPYDLFVGYPVYVRKCGEAGLEHWEYEFDNDDEPKVCTVKFFTRGNDRPFVMKVWFDEVKGVAAGGKLNARWEKAGRFQFMKCSFVQTSRFCPALSAVQLPYIEDEMSGEPVAEGYRNIPQSLLDAHDVEARELTKAEPGKVTATDHQIDLSPLMRNYRGKIAEREIFVDDTQRKMWQSEIIGKASTADWDALDFNNATSEIESGRCEKWVQDDQPKAEPDKPSNGDAFLDGLPDEPGNATDDTAQGDPPETEEGQEATTGEIVDNDWAGTADKAMDKAMDTSVEAPPEWDITSKTRKRIGELLTELEIYDSPRSQKFKKRIEPVIGRWLLKMQCMTEAEGVLIVESLDAERKEQLVKIAEVEKFKADLTAGVIVDDDPFDQGEPLEDGMMTSGDAKQEAFTQAYAASEREVERVASGEPPFQTTPEWAELNKAFNTRLYEHFQATKTPVFESPDAQLEWSAKTTGVASTGQWLPEHFALANAGLDAMGVAAADAETPEQTGTSPASEKQDNGLCTDGDFKELSGLFGELLPDKQYAMGSKEAHDLIRDSKAVKGVFTRIKSLETEEISDLKHYLNDLITDAKADAEERAKNLTDAV